MRMTWRVSATKVSIRARYRSRPRLARLSPSLARIPSSTNWAAMLAWSSPGRNSAGWPTIRAWRTIRSSTVVRWAWPRWRLPGDVGRRLDDHERRQRRIGGGARAVRREDVGREPALVDVELELGGDVGARELGLRGPPAPRCGCVIESAPVNTNAPSSSGRTGSWYHLLVRRRCLPLITAGHGSGDPRGAISGATRTARERPSRPSCPRGSHRPALAPGPTRTYSSRSSP